MVVSVPYDKFPGISAFQQAELQYVYLPGNGIACKNPQSRRKQPRKGQNATEREELI